MDDNPPVTGLMLVHEDRAAGYNQAEQYRLEQRELRTYVIAPFHNLILVGLQMNYKVKQN